MAAHQHPVDGGLTPTTAPFLDLDPSLQEQSPDSVRDGRAAVQGAIHDGLLARVGMVAVAVGGVGDGDEDGPQKPVPGAVT
jgi:hypothetical protein